MTAATPARALRTSWEAGPCRSVSVGFGPMFSGAALKEHHEYYKVRCEDPRVELGAVTEVMKHDITIVNGFIKQLFIGGPHLVWF